MDAARLENLAADFTSQSPLNHVCIELSGEELTLFDRPLLGYACAGDPLFEAFLAPGVIGPHYRPPQAWLETAQTVVSFFLPFSQAVRAQNRAAQSLPSQAWLYGRVEGQRFVEALSLRLLQALQEAGFEAAAPSLSRRISGRCPSRRRRMDPPLPATGPSGTPRMRAAWAPSACRRDSSRGTAWPAASAAWSPAGKPLPPRASMMAPMTGASAAARAPLAAPAERSRWSKARIITFASHTRPPFCPSADPASVAACARRACRASLPVLSPGEDGRKPAGRPERMLRPFGGFCFSTFWTNCASFCLPSSMSPCRCAVYFRHKITRCA